MAYEKISCNPLILDYTNHMNNLEKTETPSEHLPKQIPDEKGFIYFSRYFQGFCCDREMIWEEKEGLLHCTKCGSVSHRD